MTKGLHLRNLLWWAAAIYLQVEADWVGRLWLSALSIIPVYPLLACFFMCLLELLSQVATFGLTCFVTSKLMRSR